MSTQFPTEAQIAAFEALRQGRIEELLTPGLLTGEQILVGLLLRLIDLNQQILGQVKDLNQALPEQKPSDHATILAVTFNLDPHRLNDILIATPAVRGYLAAGPIQFPTLVPAGGTATVQIPPPPGYVIGTVGAVEISSTDVSAQVQVTASLDGTPLVGPQGFVLGPPAQITAAGAIYATAQGLVVELSNPSASNVTVWMFSQMLTIARVFYDKFIAALENAAYQAISQAYGLQV